MRYSLKAKILINRYKHEFADFIISSLAFTSGFFFFVLTDKEQKSVVNTNTDPAIEKNN